MFCAGGDAGRGQGLVPRFELAAGADPAQSRLRRALRLRLPDPAQARSRLARRAARHRPSTSPICTPGARSISPAPAGSARPDLRPADRRKPHAARRHAALPQRRADLRHGELRQRRFRLRHEGRRASPSIRASPSRSPTKAGQALDALGNKVDAALAAGRRAPDHGRRADLRLDRRLRVGRMEHRRRRADQAREGRRADPPPARALRARRLPPLRPGQMVSGRNACRAGPSRSTGARDGKPVWSDADADRARGEPRPTPAPKRCREACSPRSPASSASTRRCRRRSL